MVGVTFSTKRCNRYSVAMQATTAIRVTLTASQPKTKTDQRNAGNSARITRYMIFFTESSVWTCGEGDMVIILFISRVISG